jgi:hypothetical protein
MAQDSSKDAYVVIADLGRKIGIRGLSMQDFDLVFADADGVEKYCDQFEAIELSSAERFHFMQLIVASLDLALETNVPGADASEGRVERLILEDLAHYKYIIDYWGRRDCSLHTVPMMARLKRDSRYVYEGGEAMFEDPPQ